MTSGSAARSGRAWHSRPGTPRSPLDSGSAAFAEVRAGTRNAWRTACTPPSAPPRSRPPGLQAGHPVGQPVLGTPPRVSKHPASRPSVVTAFIGGEPYRPEPRPGRHRAAHVQAALQPSRSPAPHPATAPPDGGPDDARPPRRLDPGGQVAEIPCRTRIPGRVGGRQPLGRDPPVRRAHPLGDQRADLIVVVAAVPASWRRGAHVVPLHHPLDVLCVVPQIAAAPGNSLPPGRRPVCPSVPSRSSIQAAVR
jgi:hypothetical protein